MFLCFVNFSESLNQYKYVMPSLNYTIERINERIPELKSAYGVPIIPDEFCSITLSFNIYRNYEVQDDIIYYGGIELRLYRSFKEKIFNSDIAVIAFREEYYTVLINPTADMIKDDAFKISNELFDKLALAYYKDN